MATIQGIYIALFGRPADPAGLAYFSEETSNGADLTAIGDLAGTDEYKSRFTGLEPSEIVNSIYQSLFERDAIQTDLDYWLEEWEAGRVNINDIAIRILDGAKDDDLVTVNLKIAAADLFTSHLDLDIEKTAYNGRFAESVGRDYIDAVTTAAATGAQADTAILRLFPDQGQGPGGGSPGGGGSGIGNRAPTATDAELGVFYVDENEVIGNNVQKLIAASDAAPTIPYNQIFQSLHLDNGILTGKIPVQALLTIVKAADADNDAISLKDVLSIAPDAQAKIVGNMVEFSTPINAVSGLKLVIADSKGATTEAKVDLGLALVGFDKSLTGDAVQPESNQLWQGTGGNVAENFHTVTTNIAGAHIELALRAFNKTNGDVPLVMPDGQPDEATGTFHFVASDFTTDLVRYGFSIKVENSAVAAGEMSTLAVVAPELTIADLIADKVHFQLLIDTNPSAGENFVVFDLYKEQGALLPYFTEGPYLQPGRNPETYEDSGYFWKTVDGTRLIIDDEGPLPFGTVTQNAGTPRFFGAEQAGSGIVAGDYSVKLHVYATEGKYAGLDITNTVVLGVQNDSVY